MFLFLLARAQLTFDQGTACLVCFYLFLFISSSTRVFSLSFTFNFSVLQLLWRWSGGARFKFKQIFYFYSWNVCALLKARQSVFASGWVPVEFIELKFVSFSTHFLRYVFAFRAFHIDLSHQSPIHRHLPFGSRVTAGAGRAFVDYNNICEPINWAFTDTLSVVIDFIGRQPPIISHGK